MKILKNQIADNNRTFHSIKIGTIFILSKLDYEYKIIIYSTTHIYILSQNYRPKNILKEMEYYIKA